MMKSTDTTSLIRVGITDDHVSVTHAFTRLLNSMNGIRCTLEAYSGEQLLKRLQAATECPDILLVDVDMRYMNGIELTRKVTDLYPAIKIIAFTAKDDEWTILQMIGAGACAYLSKEVDPGKMKEAITEVYRKGKYQADLYHLYAADLRKYSRKIKGLSFTDNEKRYLQLLCKGYSYAQIAEAMHVTVNAVDYYYACISRKLDTKSQVTIALEALRMGIVTLKNDQ